MPRMRVAIGVAFVATLACILSPQAAVAQWVVLHDQNGYATRGIPDEAFQKLGDLAKKGARVRSVTFTASGGWVILFDSNGLFARNIPDDAYQKMNELVRKGAALKAIAFAPGGGWAILHDRNGFVAHDIPTAAVNELNQLARNGAELTAISFTAGGWVILHDKNGLISRNIPDEAFKKLNELAQQGKQLKSIAFTPSGGWVVLSDKNAVFARNIPDDTYQKLLEIGKQGGTLNSVSFPPRPYLQLSKDDAATRQAILARMAHFKVPGISIAVIQDGKVQWARAYGAGLSPASRFQAASISKPVAAFGALVLAQQNKIDLDRDVNQQLITWRVPENEFTRKKRPTVREILSHTAGFNVHGFGGYPAGSPVPLLRQVLDGERPANSPAIRIVAAPGTKMDYSGGGYCVLQQLLIDATKTPFPKLMQEHVLGPIGMRHSAYAQPLSRDWEAEAAVAHDSAGKPIAGRWHVYPELAAAGLWTTPSDLALFVIAVSRSQRGDRDAILNPAMAKAMFTRQVGGFGLGIALAGDGRSLSFSHNGVNAGYRCVFIGFPATGQGAVLMTNSDNGDLLIGEFMENLRAEYQWPG